ncbi:MarR family winged helix-turn-helix transcriptional regulator [Paracoccus onubensis]|uniref:MarR family transcriptional regulator n=1 Tax=Paracoccus onubensis TaxID=1675788 RepID=A0A418T816_9RHOB|nr:MarR family transcriptional regulator [Paracoccus onubensis]RJE89368.1 MarR family transcriptional regulator [Paracoccus onubensis]
MSSILPVKATQAQPQADPSARFGRLLGSIFRKWRRYIDDEFRAVGFTDATRSPLIALYDHNQPMRQRDLAAQLGLDPSALVRVIQLLTERDLVASAPDADDKRTKRISLTAEGRSWAEFIIAKSMEAERKFLTSVSDEEIAAMRSALIRISANIPDG